MMRKSMKLDVTGQRYGRLVAIRPAPSRKKATYWLFKCDCGNEKEIALGNVRAGLVISCKCFHAERISEINTTHGQSNSKIYRTWSHMKGRCYDKNDKRYCYYGARGIKVCKRWKDSFSNFLKDMGECPQNHTLDRINVNGNYTPKNCRWATNHQQAKNRTDNIYIMHKGKKIILMEFAKIMDVNYKSLYNYITYRSYNLYKAMKQLKKSGSFFKPVFRGNKKH